eukprot:361022-Chlamydomonas_euryale.AAC.3
MPAFPSQHNDEQHADSPHFQPQFFQTCCSSGFVLRIGGAASKKPPPASASASCFRMEISLVVGRMPSARYLLPSSALIMELLPAQKCMVVEKVWKGLKCGDGFLQTRGLIASAGQYNAHSDGMSVSMHRC